jgi:ribosomal protein S12 methylthiotransferase accessory factor
VLPAVPHRSLSADLAVETALREVRRLDFLLRVEEVGSDRQRVCISRLVRDGSVVAVGAGKGVGLQGIASAHFEALECYFMSAPSNRRYIEGAAALLGAQEVASQTGLREDLVIQRWVREFPESVAACAIHHGARTSVWYPTFLSDPRYHLQPLTGDSVEPYRSLLRYTSSVGTASGANVQEAVLHGLCELIEHDGLSHALLGWFIAGMPQVDLVDPWTLPDRLHRRYLDAVAAVGAQVFLLDVTTDVGVPVYVAIKDDDDAEPALFGSGASPSGEYAAERALSELIQLNALVDPKTERAAIARLSAWPALQECVRLPVRRLLSETVRHVALRSNVGDTGTVESCLGSVTRLLNTRGIEFYSCELAPPESEIAVATTIAPGLERFSLLRLGVPVVPTGRGWSVWAAARARQLRLGDSASGKDRNASPHHSLLSGPP